MYRASATSCLIVSGRVCEGVRLVSGEGVLVGERGAKWCSN